ncbi:MAG: Ogr/Delta-like zinc finger [Verrucomicrobiota bacterium]|jgi:hypothetical protein
MRIRCPHCQTLSTISNCKEPSTTDKDIYVNCVNPACNARTVHRISYSHDVRPPAGELLNMFEELLAKMDPVRRSELFKCYGPQGQQGA